MNFDSIDNKVTYSDVQTVLHDISDLLSEEYKVFLIENNGGVPDKNQLEIGKFDSNSEFSDCYVGIESFFSLQRLKEVWSNTRELLSEHMLFPIAEIYGGMLLCISYSTDFNGWIFYYDFNFGKLKLCPSVKSLIDNLISEDEVDYKKYGYDI